MAPRRCSKVIKDVVKTATVYTGRNNYSPAFFSLSAEWQRQQEQNPEAEVSTVSVEPFVDSGGASGGTTELITILFLCVLAIVFIAAVPVVVYLCRVRLQKRQRQKQQDVEGRPNILEQHIFARAKVRGFASRMLLTSPKHRTFGESSSSAVL